MNELIIIGILSVIFLGMCLVVEIVENWDAICDWLFDVQTAYYKFKARRRHKRGIW